MRVALHAGPWLEAAMFAPAFLIVGVAIVRSLVQRQHPADGAPPAPRTSHPSEDLP